MKSWVENYFHDSAEDFEIMGAMKGFAQTVMSASSMELASLQLVRSIEKRLTGLPRKLLITANRDCPLPIIPKNLKKIRFLDLDPLEVARQLTIMEARDFNKIQPNEFLSKAWSVKNGNSVAENVQAMVRMSNNVRHFGFEK